MAETATLTREDRIALARAYHADNAIIQGAWSRKTADGRDLVCALAAFGKPGEINGSADCPAEVMPQWLAHLVPAIDDGISGDQVSWFFGALLDRAARWHVLDDAAWDRIQTGPDLIEQLGFELDRLAKAHPAGFLVRLHVLGDFWSPAYVEFWGAMLQRHPALHLFGFTAHEVRSEIGRAVALLIASAGWSRAAIRFSGAPHENGASRVLGPDETDPDAILCPAQTGATDCCATCALCWHSPRSIAFRRH